MWMWTKNNSKIDIIFRADTFPLHWNEWEIVLDNVCRRPSPMIRFKHHSSVGFSKTPHTLVVGTGGGKSGLNAPSLRPCSYDLIFDKIRFLAEPSKKINTIHCYQQTRMRRLSNEKYYLLTIEGTFNDHFFFQTKQK